MKNIKKLALIIVLLGFTLSISAQGIIRGTVTEAATGEPLFGVTAVIDGTTTGASTDFDGKFEIKTSPGIYKLNLTFISFKTVVIEGVEVKEGEVTLLPNISLVEDSEVLAEVVVTAEALQTTEEALLTVKRKSVNLFDGISSASFKKIGDSDAATAVKRVPGISIEGGKYVFVRGLGDRYTKTILNGVDIPGLDPDRNTLQMDIFPTNILDNIIVVKAFTPDLPADFTGGIVDIALKDFPDEKMMNISASLGFNPNMHLQDQYLTYNGSSTDFLGFDDGLRDIPVSEGDQIVTRFDVFRDNSLQPQFTETISKFNTELAAMRDNSFMDYSLGLSFGNQMAGEKNTWGYNFAFSYKNSTEFYEDAEYNFFGKANDPSENELVGRELQKGDFGVNNILLSGLGGLALKREKSKYRLNVLHLQNGESKAGLFNYIGADQGSNFVAEQHNLEYSQRSITNVYLNGTHYNSDGKWEVEWKISPTRSSIDDPDIRFTRIRTDSDQPSIGTESGIPQRIWRSLTEYNLANKLDVTRKTTLGGRDAKIKAGASYTYKQRDYTIENFAINTNNITVTANPNDILTPENYFNVNDNRGGVFFTPQFIPVNPNKYDATISHAGAYISSEFNLGEKLKSILGVRAESYLQQYSGEDQTGLVFDNEKVIDDFDLFPSVNFIYALSDNDNASQNLRFSFSRTIARPSFKEASIATIIDPITGRTFLGGLFQESLGGEVIWDGNLVATNINNFDVRWEMFQKRGQTLSLSAFYKTFENPIEIVQFVTASNNYQPRNVGDGRLLGLELEFRQNLGKFVPALDNFSINSNITIVESQIDMSASEIQTRENRARTGETISDTRDMAGQAPYIINTGIAYTGANNGLDMGVYYNVQGETLMIVGFSDRTDVYSVPFHSINLTANKTFGADGRIKAGLKVSNLLNDKREQVFQSYQAQDQIFQSLAPGTTISFSLGYKIW